MSFSNARKVLTSNRGTTYESPTDIHLRAAFWFLHKTYPDPARWSKTFSQDRDHGDLHSLADRIHDQGVNHPQKQAKDVDEWLTTCICFNEKNGRMCTSLANMEVDPRNQLSSTSRTLLTTVHACLEDVHGS